MRLYSTHFHAFDSSKPPLLVKEGFSWPCLLLGWVGLLLSASWVVGLLAGAVSLILAALLRHLPAGGLVFGLLQFLLALFANDLRRWELGMRGFVAGPLVSGRDADAALVRLLDRQPELFGGAA